MMSPELLQQAAPQHSLRRGRDGTWTSGRGRRNRSKLRFRSNGFRIESGYRVTGGADALAVHAGWFGPTKIVRAPHGLLKVSDIFTGMEFGGNTELLDDRGIAERNELMAQMLNLACRDPSDSVSPACTAPGSGELQRWLSGLKHESQLDDSGNLRLTVKGARRDGQVRIDRSPGRVRLSMKLGRWSQLDGAAVGVMRELAAKFNDRARLVRVVFVAEADGTVHAEVQVDLSGLPYQVPANRFQNSLWLEMLRAALSGIDLAMRQLALELPLLSNPGHRELVELLM